MSDEITDAIWDALEDEVDGMAITLTLRGREVGEAIERRTATMAARGMAYEEIRGVLERDLRDGGPIFGNLRRQLRNSVGANVDQFTQAPLYGGGDGDGRREKWITTSGHPCEDCGPRHGYVRTHAEWVRMGLPRSGFSKCEDACMCVLVPEEAVPEDFGENVEVPTLAEFRRDFQERLKTDTAMQRKLDEYRKQRNAKARARRAQAKADRNRTQEALDEMRRTDYDLF